MDPLSLSTTLAIIVGLICNFKQERKNQGEETQQEFLAWLDEHRHKEIKKYITQNIVLSQAIDSLLRQNHDLVMQQLNNIEYLLASLLGQITGLDNIVQAIEPGYKMSEQAIDILRQLVNSNSDSFIKLFEQGREGPVLALSSGGSRNIKFKELRFLNDDLNNLVKLRLLNLQWNSSENEVYEITRNAEKLIQIVDLKK